ncbi:MAG: prolyl oligopeptidase family serine peptidase [Leptolyngbya sp. Prado105]|jgi:dipeptidyl aminopeptidase/acylaminoacyl peptidase|nr:prolyl oligopeptidase family serine peptidase [Leptolyngbya sp. Prado105]
MNLDASQFPAWQTPPEPIHQILTTPANPTVLVSPTRQWLLELELPDLCSIAQLAELGIAIAGFRIDPKTYRPARQDAYQRMWIKSLDTGTRQAVALPKDAQINYVTWSPDGQKVAFTLKQSNGLELWVLDLTIAKPWQVTAPTLNATYGIPYQWQSNEAFLCKVVPSERDEPPTPPTVPTAPRIEENLGRKTPTRTYTNLLANSHDEALFEYYLTSTLEQIYLTGERRLLVPPSLIDEVKSSPDGQYILLTTLHRPFSYHVPASRFPRKIQLLDATATIVRELADLPLDDQRSIKFDAVRPGRRQVSWRGDCAATLFWIEALDQGDPTCDVPHRDAWFTLEAPFTAAPQEIWRSQYRYHQIRWGEAAVALAWEQDYDSRRIRLWRIAPDLSKPPQMLVDRSFEDKYQDEGSPLMKLGKFGRAVLQFTSDRQSIYLSGQGASPQGVYPFLNRMTLSTGVSDRLWQCEDPYFERILAVLDPEAQTFITRRQSKTEPPNYFLYHDRQVTSLTDYPDPAPQFAEIQTELVQYHRADGVPLSAKLYLPAGYDPERDGTLPIVFWVYPAEFKSRETAGQITTSHHSFSRPSRASVLFLLTQGYAVLSDPKLPIIGEGEAEPNDTYVEQLIAGAEAAIEYVVNRGIAIRDRIGIGGHSYGAFTTANLLAHTSLFKMGIARSGAYNRTLTPFGFQGEQRNFWEATETYQRMAPFTYASQIQAPLLLIHGEQDSNPGTYPVQTERLFEALKGLGATVRWVQLPLEDHGYRSKEAIAHVLWEMVRWCDLYLK